MSWGQWCFICGSEDGLREVATNSSDPVTMCESCAPNLSACPVPLESMIEEMKRGGASVELESNEHLTSVRRCDGDETLYKTDPDLRTAIESLHAAYRERQDGE